MKIDMRNNITTLGTLQAGQTFRLHNGYFIVTDMVNDTDGIGCVELDTGTLLFYLPPLIVEPMKLKVVCDE